jgi:hypothetical protein
MISKIPRMVGRIASGARQMRIILAVTDTVAIKPQKMLTIPLIKVITAMVFTRPGLSPYEA